MREAQPDLTGDDLGPRLPGWVRWLVLVVLLVAAVVYLRQSGSEFASSLELRPRFLLMLAVSELVQYVLRGLLTRILCARFQVKIGVVEATKLAAWTSFANYVVPLVGGTGLRAVYLKRHHQLAYTSFLSVQMATYTLHFQVAALFGLASLPLLPSGAGGRRWGIAAGLVLVLAACQVLHHWPFARPRGEGRFSLALGRVLSGWSEVRSAMRWPLLLALVANAVALAVSIWLAFVALGITISAPQAMFIAAVYSLSIVIAVTPAALGVSEGAAVLAATAAGLAGAPALAAAAVRRVVAFAVAALGAALAQVGHRQGGPRLPLAGPPATPSRKLSGAPIDDLAAALACGAWRQDATSSKPLASLLATLVILVYAMGGDPRLPAQCQLGRVPLSLLHLRCRTRRARVCVGHFSRPSVWLAARNPGRRGPAGGCPLGGAPAPSRRLRPAAVCHCPTSDATRGGALLRVDIRRLYIRPA